MLVRAAIVAALLVTTSLGIDRASGVQAVPARQPLSTILTYNYSPSGRAGEALGLRIAVNNFTHVAVPVVFGAIGSAFGLSPVFWANSVFLAAGGYASLRRLPGAAR